MTPQRFRLKIPVSRCVFVEMLVPILSPHQNSAVQIVLGLTVPGRELLHVQTNAAVIALVRE